MLAVSIATVYAAFLLLLSKVSMCLVLSLGPVFIALALFDSTKAFFEAWVRQLSNYFILTVLVFTVLSTFLEMYSSCITTIKTSSAEGSTLGDTLNIVVLSFLQFLIFMQVPGLAAGLAGGVTLGQWSAGKRTLGRAGAAAGRYAGSKSLSTAQSAGKAASGAVGSTARAFQRTFQGRNSMQKL